MNRGHIGRNICSILALSFLFIVMWAAIAGVAIAVPNSMNIQGKLTSSSGTLQTGTFNFTFRIYDSFTSGNLLYEKNTTATTDARGVYDVILKDINLTFQDQLYLAVKVGSDGEMEPRINLTSSPYSFRANISEDLNKNNSYAVKNINVSGNVSVNNRTLFVDSENGLVGIGTISPQDNLEIIGNVRISGGLNSTSANFSRYLTSNNTLFVNGSRVGIGTSSPAEKFSIVDENTFSVRPNGLATGDLPKGVFLIPFGNLSLLADGGGDPAARVGMFYYNGAQWLSAAEVSNRGDSSYSSLLLMKSGGNVGIGTSSPNAKLTVIGGINASGGLNVTAGDVLLATTSGNVGIGTTNPTDNLVVIGSLVTYGSLNATSINATQMRASKINVSDSVNVTQTVQAARFVGNGSALTNVLPSGMIAFFPGSCPTGWSEYTSLRGRVVIGTPSGGTGEGTVGTALTDLSSRSISEVVAHQHAIDPTSTTSTSESSHTHSADPPSTASGGISASHSHTGPSHTHTVDPPSTSSSTGTTSSDGTHTHDIRARNLDGSGAKARTGASDDTSFPSESAGAHTHTVSVTVDIASFDSGSSGTASTGTQSADHTHTTDIGSFTSGAGSAHSHSTDIVPFTSGANGTATVDVTMPYLQLTACQAP